MANLNTPKMANIELEKFKVDINLSEVAASRGYVIDKRQSSRNSAVMRHPDGDKIIVARNESGGWMYFSVRDHRDNGTVIDFLQNRDGGSLGDVRKTLRSWRGGCVQHATFAPDLLPLSRDRARVLSAWEAAQDCVVFPCLTRRGIDPKVLALPRFLGRVRKDARNNALFPHYDKNGLSGYEIKNTGFTGFAPGGEKGLWYSQITPQDRYLVLTESAIDAISYHVLHESEDARYMSTGGKLNPYQPVLLRGAMEKMPVGSVIILGTDNDQAGEDLAQEIEALAPSGRTIRREIPNTGKDWNDVLKARLGLG